MTKRLRLKLNFAAKDALAAAAMALFLQLAHGQPVPTRTAAARAAPRFEVASIKPCKTGDRQGGRGGGGGGASPGRLIEHCVTVSDLIRQAYVDYADGRQNGPSWVPIEGGPAWIHSDRMSDSNRYTIEAKAEGTPDQATMKGPMLQALLADRFKLKIRRESREIPIYELTLAKGGPKLVRSKEGSCVPLDYSLPTPYPQFCGMPKRGGTGLQLIGATMADLSKVLSAPEISDRPTVDKTGITGMFDIQLPAPGELTGRGAGDAGVSRPNDPTPAAADPSFSPFEALRTAVEKLGLTLVRAKGSGERLVIDRVERPSEN